MPVNRVETVVIGAGFSGLAAALRLQDQGVSAQVLEAKAEVGGRVRSVDRGDGVREAGGATIGAGYAAVTAAAKRFGVPLVDATPMLRFFHEQSLLLNGELVRQDEWPTHSANPFPEGDRTHLPWTYGRVLAARHSPLAASGEWLEAEHLGKDASMRSLMRGWGLNEAAVALGYDLNPGYGRDAGDISALMLFARAAFSAAQRRQAPPGVVGYTVRDGVQRIAEALAAGLANEVRLNTVVTALEDRGAEVRLTCADGQIWRARQVICSLPFSVLRRLSMQPPLTGLQAEAVQVLPYQPMTQLYFACEAPFWEGDGYGPSMFTDGAAGMVAANRRGENPHEVTGLTAWAMGANALRLDRLDEPQAAALVIAEIEAARPAARGRLRYVGRQSWGGDAFAGGGWAYFRPGQITRFARTMGEPRGRVHFCGEHLARVNRGMEGAMESGKRAADASLARV